MLICDVLLAVAQVGWLVNGSINVIRSDLTSRSIFSPFLELIIASHAHCGDQILLFVETLSPISCLPTHLRSYRTNLVAKASDADPSICIPTHHSGHPNKFVASLSKNMLTSLSCANTEPDTLRVSPLAIVPILTYLPLPSIVINGGLLVVPSDVTQIVLMTWRALSMLVEIVNAKSDPPASPRAASNQRYSFRNFFMEHVAY